MVALPAMNIVYIGLDNPVKIAVEGYSNNQLAVTGYNHCMIAHVKDEDYVLKASVNGTCGVIVSYKKRNSIQSDTIEFRVKSVPQPLARFGELESGKAWPSQLLNQNTINAALPNFSFKGIEFTVIHCEMLYVTKRGPADAYQCMEIKFPLN